MRKYHVNAERGYWERYNILKWVCERERKKYAYDSCERKRKGERVRECLRNCAGAPAGISSKADLSLFLSLARSLFHTQTHTLTHSHTLVFSHTSCYSTHTHSLLASFSSVQTETDWDEDKHWFCALKKIIVKLFSVFFKNLSWKINLWKGSQQWPSEDNILIWKSFMNRTQTHDLSINQISGGQTMIKNFEIRCQ